MKRIIGIFISLCISVSCLGAPVFAADEDKILLEEHFDFAADESGSDVGAWNGWIAECGDLQLPSVGKNAAAIKWLTDSNILYERRN